MPPGPSFPLRGNGIPQVVPGTSPIYGTGPLRRFDVEIEGGMSVNGQQFARTVEQTLGDPRGWTHGGTLSLQRVGSGPVDFHVMLTSALTTRVMCGYTLHVETSCDTGGGSPRAVINVSRWTRGAVAYGDDLPGYRDYVVNHEVGHALGHGHLGCPASGALAPVMMEQTLGVSTQGRTCRANPWPYVGGRLVTGPSVTGY